MNKLKIFFFLKRILGFITPASAKHQVVRTRRCWRCLRRSEVQSDCLPDDWIVVHVCRRRPTRYIDNREIILTVYKPCSRGRECGEVYLKCKL